jgi:predicted PurR-regulated permease PerM
MLTTDAETRLRRVVPLIAVSAALILFVAVFVYASQVFFLFFAGMLLAILLRAATDWLTDRTGMRESWSLAAVVITALVAFGLVAYALAPGVAVQIDELVRQVPQAWERLNDHLEQYEWGRRLLSTEGTVRSVVSQAPGVVSHTFGFVSKTLLVLLFGVFLAAEPRTYTRGFLSLVPAAHRPRTEEILSSIAAMLRLWLMTQMVLMVFVGAGTYLGLSLLGVPLALTLGLLAALLNFVPNIGPIVAAVPAVLIALSVDLQLAWKVALVYLVVQQLESYVLQPILHRKVIALPPGLTLSTQVLMAVLFGTAGLALAVPSLVVITVAVRMIYIEGVLGEDAQA